jgi:AcrR family transcriptional regulator
MVAKKKSAAQPQKHGYHHGDLKNALIEEALRQTASHGAHSLSLREVARSAGVSHAASYRHFRGKEDLLAAIAEQGFVMLAHALHTAIEKHPDDPVAAFHASGVAYVAFGVEHPEYLQVMFGGVLSDFGPWPALQEAGQRAYHLLKGAVHAALQTGRIHGDEDAIALASWSLVHGLTQLIVGGQIARGKQSAQGLAETVTSLLLQGLQESR